MAIHCFLEHLHLLSVCRAVTQRVKKWSPGVGPHHERHRKVRRVGLYTCEPDAPFERTQILFLHRLRFVIGSIVLRPEAGTTFYSLRLAIPLQVIVRTYDLCNSRRQQRNAHRGEASSPDGVRVSVSLPKHRGSIPRLIRWPIEQRAEAPRMVRMTTKFPSLN